MSFELAEFAKRLAAFGPGMFVPGQRVTVARAPGRLDVMGGIADYSGSLVLELPLQHATLAAVQLVESGHIKVVSREPSSLTQRQAQLSVEDWHQLRSQEYAAAQHYFASSADDSWLAYVVGPLLVLTRECGCQIPGAAILIESNVPEGKGVSSSAAIEVATMRATTAALKHPLPELEMARLCQLAENEVAGAPCGIMDQMTAVVGRQDHLLALRCQPAEVQGNIAIPDTIGFWGVDSGIRHAVSGFDYQAVRVGAFMGYRIIAALSGLEARRTAPGRVTIVDSKWNGYLANITPEQFERHFASSLPERLEGSSFLTDYTGISDGTTEVRPEQAYPVLAATRHPIEEHARVERFRQLLDRGDRPEAWKEMGSLMYAAHESYSACGLGSEGTDRLVAMCRDAGPAEGIFGARITGGGSGGTVAVLARSDAEGAIQDIARRYAEQTGLTAVVFSGSSSGAAHVAPEHILVGEN